MTKIKTVSNLTEKVLRESFDEGNPVYTPSEIDFLSTYSPHSLSQKPIKSVNSKNFYEVMSTIFERIVKLDIAVTRSDDLEALASEQGKLLNPLYKILGLDQATSTDPAEYLCQLKNTGMEAFNRALGQIDHRVGVRETNANYDSKPAIKDAKEKIIDLFDPEAILLFGSSRYKEGSDVDTRIIVDEITPDTYREIQGTYDEEDPIDYILVPKDYSVAFHAFDPSLVASPENSSLLSGSVSYPIVSREHEQNLKVHNSARQIVKLRSALTGSYADKSEKSIDRFNSILKRPKFIGRSMNAINPNIKEPTNYGQFEEVPDRQTIVDSLIEANVLGYDLMEQQYENNSEALEGT